MKTTLIAAMFAASFVCGASAAHKDYLRFTARGGSVTIGMTRHNTSTTSQVAPLTLEWTDDPDAATWNLLDAGSTTVAIGEDKTAYFRQHDPERKGLSNEDNYAGWHFTMTADGATPSATVEAAGNVLSVIDATCEGNAVGTNGLSYLFCRCSILTTPPELPATHLATRAYFHMFDGCAALTRPPQLPATELGSECYSYMFFNCSNLASAPALSAMTLAASCYSYMFRNCTSLVFAPHLPATTLARACYYCMFSGCAKLKRVSVGFQSWQTDNNETKDWLKGVATSGRFIKPAALSVITGTGNIPSGWTTYAPMTTNLPVTDGLTVAAVVDGQTIFPTRSPDGTTDVFTFCSIETDVEITNQTEDGYALVCLEQEAQCQSPALQFDGFSFADGAARLSFCVRTSDALNDSDWQPAVVSSASLSPDGKKVTLTIPATAAQGFYRMAKPD